MKVKIDANKARELLALNTRNRRLSRKLVEKYAADMTAGRWPYNGDPIRVSVSNVLLDGQHRLQAIIDCGLTIEAELIEGLPDDVAMTIDGGRKRSSADVLNMLDGSSMLTTSMAACARSTLNYLAGYSMSNVQSTPAVVTLIHAHPDIIKCVTLAREADRVTTISSLSAVLFLGTREVTMEKRAQQFVEPLKHGEGLNAGDPRLALRNGFLNARMRSGSASRSIDPRWAFTTVTQCWNAFVTGREIAYTKVLSIKDGKAAYPDVIGGPKFGAGLEALNGEIKLHHRQKLAPLDESGAVRSEGKVAALASAKRGSKIVSKL